MAAVWANVRKNVYFQSRFVQFKNSYEKLLTRSIGNSAAVSWSSNRLSLINGNALNNRIENVGAVPAGLRLDRGGQRYFSSCPRSTATVFNPSFGCQVNSRFWIMHGQRRMAGHSKWSNIKHIKGAKDAAKSVFFAKIGRQIKLAIQDGKSNDPRFNNALAHAIDQAKQGNMPVAKIEAMLKGAETNKETMFPFTIEARGPGGCFIIIETLSDNVKRSQAQIKNFMSKCGAAQVDSSVQHAFSYKGTLNVDASTSKLDLEKAVELAIEVGAEDVVESEEDDGLKVFQFLSDPKEYFSVKNELTKRGYDLKTAGLNYIPKIKVTLSDDQMDLMGRLFEYLNEHPDVVKFYENVE